MIDFLDYSMAWVAALALLVVLLKYTARAARVRWKGSRAAAAADHALHNIHKPAGIVVVAAGLIHGLASPTDVLCLNLGTVLLVLASLMGLLYLLRKILKPKHGWIHTHRILAIVTATVLFCHIVEVGGVQVFHVAGEALSAARAQNLAAETMPATFTSPSGTASTATTGTATGSTAPATTSTTTETAGGLAFDGVTLADGTYSGTAQGYGPGLTVAVVVENGLVASIEVTDHNEKNSRYYTRPIARIPDAIVSAQSLDVDTISGATFTSIGILNAVRDALTDAVVSGELPDALKLPAGIRH